MVYKHLFVYKKKSQVIKNEKRLGPKKKQEEINLHSKSL